VTDQPGVEGLLRELAPQALAIVARRHASFAECEDAVQEALIKAVRAWPATGTPDRPLGWLVRVASREIIGRHRSDSARRRREDLAASWALDPPDPAPDRDDTLSLLFLCCHDALTPASAIPLTLRAVGGLTTREIADAFLVREATMAQRISRAKATIKASSEPFGLPGGDAYRKRLRSVLHVLYLIFNEGHTASGGSELGRPDLAAEAIRVTRLVHEGRPEDPEITGLLALMVLTDARRAARTGPRGQLVPLADQDRGRWDRAMIREGIELATAALRRHRPGPYQLQAAIAAVHAQAGSYDDTDWSQVLALYNALERRSTNPIVTVNRAVATAMAGGPAAGLEVLDTVSIALGDHHRYHAVRAHLLEQAGRIEEALAAYGDAVRRVTNVRERTYLQSRAASIRQGR
jgi:RNA polymerase sigma factor (sigma-70 family)